MKKPVKEYTVLNDVKAQEDYQVSEDFYMCVCRCICKNITE